MKYFWSILFILIALVLSAEDTLSIDSTINIQFNSFEQPPDIFSKGKSINRVAKLQDFSQHESLNTYWWYLIVISIALVVVFVINNQYSKSLLKSLSNIHVAQKMARSPNNVGVFSAYMYILLFCGVLAIVLSQVTFHFFEVKPPPYLYFIIFFLFIMLEIVLIEITGFILNKKQLIQKIRFSNTSLLFIAVIIFLPLAYFMLFSKANVQIFSTYIFIIFSLLIFLFREYRTYRFILLEKKSIGFFHFFLYICTFKITPFILLVKVLINIV